MPSPSPEPALLDLFDLLRDELRTELVDRDREIHGMLVALLSCQHILFLGGPGIAKSQLVDRTFARISGIRYQKFPMHRLMSSDDVFGPVDVRAYAEEGRFRRILDGFLGDVEYANLEEIFKAGPSALGLLLPILNERVLRNDGKVNPVDLRMIACSSNELPKDDITAPLYDRIPIRYEVKAPEDKALIQKMLELEIRPIAELLPVLTAAQLHEAQAQTESLPYASAVAERLTEVYWSLAEKGIRPTPRRLRWTMRVMQAEAWLDGSDVVAVDHISIAAHTLWDLPAQQGDVMDSVLAVANPTERLLLQLLTDVGDIRKMLPAAISCDNEQEQQARGMEIYHKITDGCEELNKIIAFGGTGRRHRELLESVRQALHDVIVPMITQVMHMPIEDVSSLGLPDIP